MTYFFRFFLMLIFITFASSCSFESSDDCSPAEIELAKEQGVKDALKVCELDSETMEHEDAILRIRVKEVEMKEHGYGSAAEAYADAAESTLRSKGLIH